MFLLVPLIFYSHLAQQILNLYFRNIILGFRSDKRIEDDQTLGTVFIQIVYSTSEPAL